MRSWHPDDPQLSRQSIPSRLVLAIFGNAMHAPCVAVACLQPEAPAAPADPPLPQAQAAFTAAGRNASDVLATCWAAHDKALQWPGRPGGSCLDPRQGGRLPPGAAAAGGAGPRGGSAAGGAGGGEGAGAGAGAGGGR